jgi:2-oxoisovalerate dehydrogenase E1 component alpha subunit
MYRLRRVVVVSSHGLARRASTAAASVAASPGRGYPGAPLSAFTSSLSATHPPGAAGIIPTFRALTPDGAPQADLPSPVANRVDKLDESFCTGALDAMVKLRAMDAVCVLAHRQGRVAFYASSQGEEGSVIGAAAGLAINDEALTQYREQGVLLYRVLQTQVDDDPVAPFMPFMRQNVGSALDQAKGAQMPMHYGSVNLNFQTVSSTVAPQLVQAVGAAYAFKRSGESASRIAVTFLGDGASSTDSFHAALNLAATVEAVCSGCKLFILAVSYSHATRAVL